MIKMKIKGNFVCQDKLLYVPVQIKPFSNKKLISYTYQNYKTNKYIFFVIFVLTLLVSFFITYFNFGAKIQKNRLLPDAYQQHTSENESLLNVLNKYKNVVDKFHQ